MARGTDTHTVPQVGVISSPWSMFVNLMAKRQGWIHEEEEGGGAWGSESPLPPPSLPNIIRGSMLPLSTNVEEYRVGWGKTPTLRNYPHIFAIKHWITNDEN